MFNFVNKNKQDEWAGSRRWWQVDPDTIADATLIILLSVPPTVVVVYSIILSIIE